MPRFHFDLHDGVDHPDVDGVILPDVAAARIEAVRYAGELLHGQPELFWRGEEWTMTVTNAERLALFSLTIMATDAPALSAGRPAPTPPQPDPPRPMR